MDSFLWATGSMLLVMLIVQFLPLGITKTGKLITVLAAFLLATVGLVAISSYSLWNSIAILFVLVSITTYLLNSRLGQFLHVVDDSYGKKLLDKEEPLIDYNKSNKSGGYDLFSLSQNEVAATIEQSEEKEEMNAELFYTPLETKQEQVVTERLPEFMDEDITFLLNRSIQIDDERVEEDALSIPDFGDLSDIESLLLEAEGKLPKVVGEKTQILENEDELPIMTFDSFPIKIDDQEEKINPLEELDELPILTFQEDELEKSTEAKKKVM
jgi:hypothetical protein